MAGYLILAPVGKSILEREQARKREKEQESETEWLGEDNREKE